MSTANTCDKCKHKMDDVIASVDIEIVGIAKDGWVIYGPIKNRKSSGDVEYYSACDVDVCNGKRD